MSMMKKRRVMVRLIFYLIFSFTAFYLEAQDSLTSYIRMSGFSGKKEYFIAYSATDSIDYSKRYNYRIKKDKGHKYIIINDQPVFLDYSVAPKYEADMLKFFKDNFKEQNTIRRNSPFIFLVFIIDNEGKIVSMGFNRNVYMDSYQRQFFHLLKQVNGKFSPAEIDGKKVACLYSFYFNYEELMVGQK